MPFLRVIRDKRGYETSYLVHWFREGNRQRSRILYVFRTPGAARVGRTALDPVVMRELEGRYPSIAFDWSSLRENQQVIEPAPDYRRRRPGWQPKAESTPAGAPATPAGVRVAAAEVDSSPATVRSAVMTAAPHASTSSNLPPVPSALQGTTADEQIAFLHGCYPQVRDRVQQRVTDPARREALLALAERLNPVMWTDADQITAGLQAAGEALERLSHVFARRRRRPRKRAMHAAEPGSS